ncbi:marvel domain-containing protein [Kalaharituber pfeilii]|nr:marvel domain-containing protein [Kalaharituber pfeilii]
MDFLPHAILRAAQFILTLLTLSLSCALAAQQRLGGSPTRVNYSIFASVFALLTLFYLLPASLISSLRRSVWHPFAALVLDTLNTIFFLAAGIALAAQLGVNSCSNRSFLGSNGITNGGGYYDMEKRCREAQALCAFFWFGFVAWGLSALLDKWEMAKGKETRTTTGMAGLGRKPREAPMAQV